METKSLAGPVKLTLLLLLTTACAAMTFYGFVHTATVFNVGEWIFSIGCTIGYFCLWLFLVWIAVWWSDNAS
jgi:Na+/proline symporter